MELRHLRYFVAVAEELHFSRAAERLHISPPSLTEQIRNLERELGAALLTRTKRNVTLTDAGARFLDEARSTLRQAEQAALVARLAGRGETGRVEVTAQLTAPSKNDAILEQVVGRLSLEPSVSAASWSVEPIVE